AATVPRYPPLAPGDRVTFEGTLRQPPADGYGTYLARIGVAATVFSSELTLDPAEGGVGSALQAIRGGADAALARVLPEPEAGLAAGILVGLRGRVDRALAADFTAAGVSHVVAISGWNIAIVAAVVAALLGRLGRRPRALATLGAIVAYTVIVGASASVLRAALMAGVVLLARESGRGSRAAVALAWAAALMLLADPTVASDAGFQLSTAATAGLIAWSRSLTVRLSVLGGRLPSGSIPGWLTETLGVSLAAQAATLPIILLDFGRVSLVSPLANLVVVPLVPAVMAGGALALAAGGLALLAPMPSAVVAVIAFPGWLLLALLSALVRAAATVPFASLTLDPPLDFVAAALAAAAVAACTTPGRRMLAGVRSRGEIGSRESAARSHRARRATIRAVRAPAGRVPRPGSSGPARHGRILLPAALIAAAAVVLVAAARPDGSLRVAILDVGQGDSILIEGGRGSRLLVDGGPDPDRLLLALDARIPAWDRRIDLLILTHPHEDHVGGLPVLLERYRVGRIFEPGMPGSGPAYRAWQATLQSEGRAVERLAAGDRMDLDGLRLRILWPPAGAVPAAPAEEGRTVNDVSIVLLGELGPQRILLTGDAEEDVDPALLAAGLPPLTLLKVAHHGSGTSSSDALLAAARPAVAVISVGTANLYGHPAAATLKRLAGAAGRVLRTDRDGTVEAIFDGERLRIVTGGPRPAPSRVSLATTAVVETPGETGRGAGVDLAAPALLYHRPDEHPRARRGRRPPPLPRPSSLAPAPLARRGRGGRLAGRTVRVAWHPGRPPPGRGGQPAP
ncbi:MAG: ComEC/Rec2 family competence protein, partial [Candidatus Limnocylindrales bacterium]